MHGDCHDRARFTPASPPVACRSATSASRLSHVVADNATGAAYPEPRASSHIDALCARPYDTPSLANKASLADRPAADDGESWTIEPEHHSLDFAGSLKLRIEFHPPRVTGQVSESLLATRPADVARLLLEAPGAGLLSRRGYMVAHAGVVVGPAGAVVIRGGSGAGKSTLVAAAHRAGF